MSLQNIHVFFIALSTLLCVGFGAWCVQAFRAEGEAGMLAMGALSFAAAATLVGYGSWFLRKMRRLRS